MKPMFALIATGIILLLVMLYFGNSSFDGVYETSVYDNRLKFNQTIEDTKRFEKLISSVKISYDNTTNITTLDFKIDDNYTDQYKLNKVSLTTPVKNNNVDFYLDNGTNKYSVGGKLKSGLYKVIYNVDFDNKTFDVQKSVYVD